jgi:hypothetical protein
MLGRGVLSWSALILWKKVAGGLLVCHVCGCEDGIAAYFWALEEPQHDVAWRLDLIAHVLMPEGGSGALLKEARNLLAVAVAVDDMKSGVIAHRPGDRLIVWFPEMAHELLQLVRASVDKILRGEGDDLALRDQQGQLVLGGVGELAQLHAFDDAPDLGLDVSDFDAGSKQIALALVLDAQGRILIFEGRQRIEPDLVPCGEVFWVSGARGGFLGDIDIGDVDVVADGNLFLVRIDSLGFAGWCDGG